MLIKFSIHGDPVGKSRPRFKRIDNKVLVYTPDKTRDYEDKIRLEYANNLRHKFDRNFPIVISIEACYRIPENISRNMRNKMLKNMIFPTKRPDGDNIIKIILDALNGVAYYDDSHICMINFRKIYSEIPMVKITIVNIKCEDYPGGLNLNKK